jgi:hypothetical protein
MKSRGDAKYEPGEAKYQPGGAEDAPGVARPDMVKRGLAPWNQNLSFYGTCIWKLYCYMV